MNINSLLTALLLGYCALQLQAADLTSELIYDKARIVEISIELPADDWKQLCQQTRDPRGVFAGKIEDPFTYFRGDITIDGTLIKSVGIRKKGFMGSLDDHFPSLKIKFDEYVDQKPVADLEGLTLNNNKQDPSLACQTLTYELFNAAGVVAPRCTFAKVTVNGEYLGIYSNVESIAKPFLQRRFKNSQGNLYEGTLADFYPPAVDRIEVKTNKKKHDRSQLEKLAQLLSEEDKLTAEQVEQLVDIDNFLRYWAIESLIGFWDGYTNNQNNYWFYQNQANNKFYFIPWGADAALVQGGFQGFGQPGPQSVYAESLLANRLIQMESVSSRYRDTMRKILTEVWKEDDLLKRLDEIEQLLAGQTHPRQGGAARSTQAVRQFIKRRRKMIEQELDIWPVRVAPYGRKPMYVVPVGSAKGSLQTVWSDQPQGGSDSSKVTMQLVLDAQAVNFESINVHIHRAPQGGFPGFGPSMSFGPPKVDIVFEGKKSEDGKVTRMTISILEDKLSESIGRPLPVDGFFVPDTRASTFGMPMGGKTVEGTIQFSKLNIKAGEPVEGTFDLKINEVRGGFMNRERVDPSAKP